ncbi:MAG TPA: DUF3330 domain-containing protein [Zeimonas sp.]|nr:DUF3330 domain-containing protein [Zeimonas sp.]
MPDHAHPVPGDERVACAVCLKEIPRSEATVAEAADYVAHFCGLDCYDKWQAKGKAQDRAPAAPPKSTPG